MFGVKALWDFVIAEADVCCRLVNVSIARVCQTKAHRIYAEEKCLHTLTAIRQKK